MSNAPESVRTRSLADLKNRVTTQSGLIKNVFHWRQTGILTAMLVMIVSFGIAEPSYFTSDNLLTILEQSAVTGILAIGSTFVIITAGIDLSFGSTVGLSAATLGVLLEGGTPIALSMAAALIVGGLAGLFNGALTTALRITPLIVTLGTMSVFSGLALLVSDGKTIFALPPSFIAWTNAHVIGLPLAVFVFLVSLVVGEFLLRRTVFGEYCIATGGNAEVARLAGIRVGWYVSGTYVVLGLLAGLAAILTVGRLGAADPQAGADLLLPVIAAAVIGGAKLAGGEGSVIGAAVGAVFISALQAGLTILVIPSFYQRLAVGTVIILAVALDKVQRGELQLTRRTSSPR